MARGAEPGTQPEARAPLATVLERNSSQPTGGIFGQYVNISACGRCHGEGKVITNHALSCHGAGAIKRELSVRVTVRRG